jgi:hypothetical protein
MSTPRRLAISAELEAGLTAWREWWERHSAYGAGEPATPADRAAWHQHGQALAAQLAGETGAEVVYWWPHGPDGDDPTCRTCRNVAHGRRRRSSDGS